MLIIDKNSDEYPKILYQIEKPPKRLFAKGNVQLLNSPCVAVIGSRNCSEYGINAAKRIAYELAQNDVTVVSGLAIGIDATAHKAAVDANGKTIAVLGSGIDNIFPTENIGLAEDIIKSGGLVISEYSPNEEKKSKYFPIRNRIVAGLSLRCVGNRSKNYEERCSAYGGNREIARKKGFLHTKQYKQQIYRDK
jgi:DNA processing protein